MRNNANRKQNNILAEDEHHLLVLNQMRSHDCPCLLEKAPFSDCCDQRTSLFYISDRKI